MKRLGLIVVGVLVLLVGGALIAPQFIDWQKYRDPALAKIQEATGYDIKISGAVDLAVFPSPHVSVEGLTVSVPNADKPLLTLEKARVHIALAPLLQKQVSVSSVELIKPDVNVSIGRDGSPSWMTETLKAKQAENADQKSGNALPISLDRVVIKDGHIRFDDLKKGTTQEANAVNLTLKAGSLTGPFDANGDLVWNKNALQLALKSGDIKGKDGAFPVSLKLELPQSGASLNWSGSVALAPSLDVQGELDTQGKDLASVLSVLSGKEQATSPLAGAFHVKGMVTANKTSAAIRDMNVSLAGLDATGAVTVDNLPQEGSTAPMQIALNLKSDSPVNLDAMLPPPSNAKKSGGFLPETLTLPAGMIVKADVSLASATFKGMTGQKVSVSLMQQHKGLKAAIKAGVNGGSFDVNADMMYATATTSGDGKSTTLSDPTMKANIVANLPPAAAQKFLAPFAKDDTAQANFARFTSDGIAFAMDATVTPSIAQIEAGKLKMNGTSFVMSGAYKQKGARPTIILGVTADPLDANKWIAPAPANQTPKPFDLKEMATKLSLPFDLDLTAEFKNVRYKDQSFARVAFKGAKMGDALRIDAMTVEALDGNKINAAGTVGNVPALQNVDLTLSGATPDVKKLMTSLAMKTDTLPKGLQAVKMTTEVKGKADKLSFVSNIGAMNATVEAAGTMTQALQTPQLGDLTVRVKHPNFEQLAKEFSPNFKSSVTMRKDMDVYAAFKQDGKIYTLSGLKAQLGQADLSGDMKFDMSGAKPFISGALQSGDLPLGEMLGVKAKDKNTVKAQRSNSGGGMRWSRDPINVAWMNAFDADLKLNAKSLTYGTWNLTKPHMAFTLKNGTLDLTDLRSGLYGGTMAMTGKVVAPAQAGQALSLSGKTDLTGVSLESFIGSFSGSQLVRGKGTINLTSDITASGASAAAIVMDLNGKAATTGKDLVLQGFDLAAMSRAMVTSTKGALANATKYLDATVSGGQTSFDTLDGAFTIKSGVVNFDKLDLVGKDATVTGTGNVNLPLWTIDLQTVVQVFEPKDAPPLKNTFKGSLDNPANTFGRGAMDRYINQAVGAGLQELLGDQLKKKGIPAIPGLTAPMGGQAAAPPPVAPSPAPVAPAPEMQRQAAPAAETVPPVAPAETSAEPMTEPAAGVQDAPLSDSSIQEVAPAPEPAPAPQEQSAPQSIEDIKPEDVINGVLQGVLGQ
jgi:uncharacterized protein involved in outer membrane biogenesis